jgi:hypothetical protein
MHPVFLFGSGTSPAPNVRELTKLVLETRMHRHTNGIFYPGDEGGRYQQEAGDKPDCIRCYLNLIREDIAKYQQREISKISYEDIANICVQLDKETGSRRNPALALYRENLCARMIQRFPSFNPKNGDLGSLCWGAMEWISWAIYHAFHGCKTEPTALHAFTHTILNEVPAATFVTLNHDVFFESILGDNVNLGFRLSPSGEELFDADVLTQKTGLRMLKLHGSVDWFWHADSGNYRRLRVFDAFEIDTAPTLLAGTISKLESYNFSIFPWLWAEFQNTLRLTRRIAVSGYGFKDIGVTIRLADWLDHYPDAQMVIIHPEPETLIDETRIETLDGVARFFHRDTITVSVPADDATNTNAKIIFLPIKFEDASNTTWAPWLKLFFSQVS